MMRQLLSIGTAVLVMPSLMGCGSTKKADKPASVASGSAQPGTKTTDSVRQRIRQIIADQLGVPVGKITPEARLVRDLGADSLDVVELIMALEEEFAIEIRDEDAEKLVTVQDLQDYIDHARKP